MTGWREPALLGRDFFERPAPVVAPQLLGQVVEHETGEGLVRVRLSEVEAYAGGADPGSHAYRGRTRRNAAMFGEAGSVYVYFVYGMHWCMNLVCLPPGTASAVLLRGGDVVEGIALARARRPGSRDRDLARGPARLTRALAVDRACDGSDACDPASPLRVRAGEPVASTRLRASPRTGVTAGQAVRWRFYLEGEASVSPYRRHVPRTRSPSGQRGG